MKAQASDAVAIWQAGVEAVRPHELLPRFAQENQDFQTAVQRAKRIFVVGGGKAGSAMAVALEKVLQKILPNGLETVQGIINVPADTLIPTQKIQLHPARPAGSNHPTAAGVFGTQQMLAFAEESTSDDLAICLISGGGSALLPLPAPGISLEDKQTVTKLLHASGATIQEMNTVRKHLSGIKGGMLGQAFRDTPLWSLIISDVVGDPLDVIASGPTVIDPSTYNDALQVISRFGLLDKLPENVCKRLEAGAQGTIPETMKQLPGTIQNVLLGNNRLARLRAEQKARQLGYPVLDLGGFIEGETRPVAIAVAGLVQSIVQESIPVSAPVCLLIGGETTVTLAENSGKGGRNQEFVLAMLQKLGAAGMANVVILSGGTDGEDGPTNAAGAWATSETYQQATQLHLDMESHLRQHDAYPFFQKVGSLLLTGPSQTNVMDLRVILIGT